MGIMKRVREYKDRLAIAFAHCADCDTVKYKGGIRKDKEKGPRFDEIYHMVGAKELFDDPADNLGFPFIKGEDYLPIALKESGWTCQEVAAAIVKLAEFHGMIW